MRIRIVRNIEGNLQQIQLFFGVHNSASFFCVGYSNSLDSGSKPGSSPASLSVSLRTSA